MKSCSDEKWSIEKKKVAILEGQGLIVEQEMPLDDLHG